MTPIDVAREIFPGKPDDWLGYAIWNRTAFPFNGREGWTAQLIEFRDALDRCPEGKFLCDFCNRHFVDEGQWMCRACDYNVPCFDVAEV